MLSFTNLLNTQIEHFKKVEAELTTLDLKNPEVAFTFMVMNLKLFTQARIYEKTRDGIDLATDFEMQQTVPLYQKELLFPNRAQIEENREAVNDFIARAQRLQTKYWAENDLNSQFGENMWKEGLNMVAKKPIVPYINTNPPVTPMQQAKQDKGKRNEQQKAADDEGVSFMKNRGFFNRKQ